MALDPAIFLAALGITVLEFTEAAAVGLALYADSGKHTAFLYVALGSLVVLVPTILVGSLMLATITEIRWTDPLVAVPSFLTLILIPLTYSIANGLGFGIIAWAVLHIATGRFRRQDWLLYVLAALFLARFIYLGTS